jgi:hypothetical protein
MRSKTETKLIAGFEVSTLRVYDNSKPYYNHKQVCVKTDFINEEDLFNVVCDSEKIVIKRFGFGYVGKTTTPTLNGGIWHLFCVSDELQNGHYEFDEEESTTDELVCYWSEQI